jgi:hypothetical protein
MVCWPINVRAFHAQPSHDASDRRAIAQYAHSNASINPW